jgi:iron only hydrogenase large subunit-like protein
VHKKSISSTQKNIKISLNDCLACSGCITTAETVLIGSQTIDQMIAGISSSKYSVVALTPQSICSLATKFDYKPVEMAILMEKYFKVYTLLIIIIGILIDHLQ